MPAGFDRCMAKGGKVRTKSLSGGKYQHICILGKKSYPGYVKKKGSGKKAKKAFGEAHRRKY